MPSRETILNYIHHQPYEGRKPTLFFTMNSTGMGGIMNIELPICERGMGSTGYDVFGVHWTATSNFSHYSPDQEPRYDDIEDWEDQVKFPDVEKFDWEAFKKDAETVDREKYVVSITSYMGPFERTTCLTNFEDCLVDLISEPEEFSRLIGAIADYKIAIINKACQIAHPDVVNLHDDWGTSESTFMSPDLWRQVIKPHIQRIYDCIKANGAIICQHSCGSIGALVGDMVEMGAQVWEAQGDSNDIPALEAQYGDKLRISANTVPGPNDPMAAAMDPSLLPPEKYPAYAEYPSFLFD